MPDTRHPDIEIYIKNRSPEQVLEWLETQSEYFEITKTTPSSTECSIAFKGGKIQVVLQQKVFGKAWSSLWFKENNTPWDTDLTCAKSAAKAMDTQIRCMKEGWSEDNDAAQEEEQWWKIENDDCALIHWRD